MYLNKKVRILDLKGRELGKSFMLVGKLKGEKLMINR